MRPYLVQYLNGLFNTQVFNSLVPLPQHIYFVVVVASLLLYVYRVKKYNLSEYHAWGSAIATICAGYIGVKLLFVVMHPAQVLIDWHLALPWYGPTISFGGYILGIAAFLIYFSRYKQPALSYLDIAASCIGLSIMIGRWACFLNGDDFGTPSNLPWAVTYPVNSFAYVQQFNSGLIDSGAASPLPVHPVQLYLSLQGLVLFVLCTYLLKKKLPAGSVFFIFWILESSGRFILEFFRGDGSANLVWGLSSGQIACLLIFIIAASGYYFSILRNHTIIPVPNSHKAMN